jgi:hypothetical protein
LALLDETTVSYTLLQDLIISFSMDEGFCKAEAEGLGLLEDGFGETQEEALDDLLTVIAKSFNWLTASATHATEYASDVTERLRNLMKPVPLAEIPKAE